MPKLIAIPKNIVKDSLGQTWEYSELELQNEEYDYSDYQDYKPIRMIRTFLRLPSGEKIVISEKSKKWF